MISEDCNITSGIRITPERKKRLLRLFPNGITITEFVDKSLTLFEIINSEDVQIARKLYAGIAMRELGINE